MALSVTESRIIESQMLVSSSISRAYNITYQVKTNQPEREVNTLWSLATGSAPDAVPPKYAVYTIDDSDGNTVIDAGAYALDFNWERRDRQNDRNTWDCSVTYRVPDPTRREHPAMDGITNPLNAPILKWIEHYIVPVNLDTAKNDDAIVGRAADTSGPITNAIGEPAEQPVQVDSVEGVLVVRWNSSTPQEADTLNELYVGTTNSLTYHGRNAGFCRFQKATSTPALFDNGVTYYETEMRVLLGNRIQKVAVPNWASGHLTVPNVLATLEADETDDGKVQDRVKIDLTGIKTDTLINVVYSYLNVTDYTILPGGGSW